MSAQRPTMPGMLPSFSLRRPVSVLVLFCVSLVLGYISYQRTPLQLLPSDFDPPFLFVSFPYPNANPKEVENQVTRPVEEVLATVHGLEQMDTRSSENASIAFLRFTANADMDNSYVEVRDALDRVRDELPDDVGDARILRFDPNGTPVAFLSVRLPEEASADPHQLLDEHFSRKLMRIPGVANVELVGVFPREVAVDFRSSDVGAHKLNLFQIIEQLKRASFQMACGKTEDGGRELFIRSRARFETLEALQDHRLASGLPLASVADVRHDVLGVGELFFLNGQSAALVLVHKESQANAIDVCADVLEFVEHGIHEDPNLAGVEVLPLFSIGEVIQDSVETLLTSAAWGSLFAIGILLVFLRRLRMTLIVTLAIPMSVLITVIYLYFSGSSFNMLSLMGIMLAVGMLVDNSVVVLENIVRLRQAGLSARQAALQGTTDVSLAVATATFTTIVAFAPLLLAESRFKIFLRAIGEPVCVSLLASLLVALVGIPIAALRLGGMRAQSTKRNAGVDRLSRAYGWLLDKALRHRILACLVLLGVAASTAWPITHLKRTFQAQGGASWLMVQCSTPAHFSLGDTYGVIDRASEILQENRERLGIANILASCRTQSGRIRCFLVDADDRPMTLEDMMEDIKKALPQIPDVTWKLGRSSEGQGDTRVQITLQGRESDVLVEAAEVLALQYQQVPGVLEVEVDLTSGLRELSLRIDSQKAHKLGVAPLVIFGTVNDALRGRELPEVRLDDEEVHALARLDPLAIAAVEDLLALQVKTAAGVAIPLGRLVTLEWGRGFQTIRRTNRRTRVNLDITSSRDDMKELYDELEEIADATLLPAGVELERGSSFRKLQESDSDMAQALPLAALFVFLLMGVLFESLLLPLAVLVSVPLSFVGVYWLLYLTDTPFDVMSGIGSIILIGVVVNNAIVLIDTVKQIRRSGVARREALVKAGSQRLRPILMTSLTTICGLLPMALGDSNLVGMPYFPLGRTVIGGMAAGTLLVLGAVPVVYSLLDDVSRWTLRLRGALAGKPRAKKVVS